VVDSVYQSGSFFEVSPNGRLSLPFGLIFRVPVRGTFSLLVPVRGERISFHFSSYRHGRENLVSRRAGTRNFLSRTGRERKYEELSLCSYRYRARDYIFFLLVPARERKLSFSSCRYEELSLPRTGTRNFLSARTGPENKFSFSSYRHGRENLVSRRAGTRNFLSRTGRERKYEELSLCSYRARD
jgi:hypothetical protein